MSGYRALYYIVVKDWWGLICFLGFADCEMGMFVTGAQRNSKESYGSDGRYGF